MDVLSFRDYCLSLPLTEESTPFDETTLVYKVAGKMFLLADMTDGRAVNYWWGMNSGVMDVLLSRELPPDVNHLAQILRSGVTSGMIDPFHCRITAQDGSVKNSGRHGLDLEQIAHMDYLCDAVDGHIPEYDELADIAKPMYRMQGIHRDLLPVEKEAEL